MNRHFVIVYQTRLRIQMNINNRKKQWMYILELYGSFVKNLLHLHLTLLDHIYFLYNNNTAYI